MYAVPIANAGSGVPPMSPVVVVVVTTAVLPIAPWNTSDTENVVCWTCLLRAILIGVPTNTPAENICAHGGGHGALPGLHRARRQHDRDQDDRTSDDPHARSMTRMSAID